MSWIPLSTPPECPEYLMNARNALPQEPVFIPWDFVFDQTTETWSDKKQPKTRVCHPLDSLLKLFCTDWLKGKILRDQVHTYTIVETNVFIYYTENGVWGMCTLAWPHRGQHRFAFQQPSANWIHLCQAVNRGAHRMSYTCMHAQPSLQQLVWYPSLAGSCNTETHVSSWLWASAL